MEEFEDTLLPHLESVARFALSLTRSEAEANDLVQETFLRACRCWRPSANGIDRRSWLFSICRDAYLLSQSRNPERLESDDADADAMPAAILHMQAVREGIAEAFDRIDVRPAIEAALHVLPEPHHSIMVLVDGEGMSYEEAASVLNVPVEAVRSRLYRARRHVQEAVLAYAREVGAHSRGPA